MRFHGFSLLYTFSFFFGGGWGEKLSPCYLSCIVLISENMIIFFDSELSIGQRTEKNTSIFPLTKDFLISISSLLPVLSH